MGHGGYVCTITADGVQEKWRLQQEENRLKASQSSLEQERLRLTETVQRERLDLEAAKVSVYFV